MKGKICPLKTILRSLMPTEGEQRGTELRLGLPYLLTSTVTGPSPYRDARARSTAVPSQAAGCQDGPGGLTLICLSLAGTNGNEGIN